jgi:hypothetical protein
MTICTGQGRNLIGYEVVCVSNEGKSGAETRELSSQGPLLCMWVVDAAVPVPSTPKPCGKDATGRSFAAPTFDFDPTAHRFDKLSDHPQTKAKAGARMAGH